MWLTTIEFFGKAKGTLHIRDLAHIPRAQILLKNGAIGKQVLHILDRTRVPVVQRLIEVNGGEKHPSHGHSVTDVLTIDIVNIRKRQELEETVLSTAAVAVATTTPHTQVSVPSH